MKASVTCGLCPHLCTLKEGQRGFCKARAAKDGMINDENYGRITSLALDPIEKKPLAQFCPGSHILSVGSYGCNMDCHFCQNASIADGGPDDVPWEKISPEELVQLAKNLIPRGNIGIAYTYNEPLVGFEFVMDCAKLIRDAGLKNVLVSNGMINPEPLHQLIPFVSAANIDLKGFADEIYEKLRGNLDCVKSTIENMARTPHLHLEVTTLIVPGLNDDPAQIAQASRWLASLDSSIVYHLTRFFPCHRMHNCPPTDVETLKHLQRVAQRSLSNVVLGNC